MSEERVNQLMHELAAEKAAQLEGANTVIKPLTVIVDIGAFAVCYWRYDLGLILSVGAGVLAHVVMQLVAFPVGYILGKRAARRLKERIQDAGSPIAEAVTKPAKSKIGRIAGGVLLALVAAITITFGRVIGNIYYDLASSVFQKGQVFQKSQVEDKYAKIQKTLQDVKLKLDAEIPKKLDDNTTLTGVRIEGTSLVFVYRVAEDLIDMDVEVFSKVMRTRLLKVNCTSFKQTLGMGASFEHEYFDRADRYNVIGAPKSRAGHRTVPLGPLVLNVLREWKLKCPRGKQRLVFSTGNGLIRRHNDIVRAFKSIGRTAGLTDADGKLKYTVLHALRHFYASWCINPFDRGGQGLPPKVVQDRLGHSSIVMTMDTYGHLFPPGDDAEKRLAEAERKLLS